MPRRSWRALLLASICTGLCGQAFAQKAMSWDEVRDLFRKNNPSLIAGRIGVQEFQASEITAGLRPNPTFSTVNDQFRVFSPGRLDAWNSAQWTQTVTQLLERRNKRGLRVESAKLVTSMATTDVADFERQMIFGLRAAFVQILQARAVLELATDNLNYYQRVLDVNRQRLQAGDIARVDLTRLELQRAQFQSDLENARVSLRTAKIQLMSMANIRQPLDSFDVAGEFDFKESGLNLEELHRTALELRPDLKSSLTAIDKAKTDNRLAWANGSTDPTIGLEYQRTPADPTGNNTMGFNISIPLRIFDRNQGEKARTALEISRAERVREGILLGIYRDVDSAFEALESVRILLRSYRDQYLKQAVEARDSVSFAYSNGGASLLDFLDAQKSYRDIQLNYRNLIGSYLASAAQLNLAVGREVIP
jgi:cobalt-zinc-cadmium efflux system outer membrane protein